MTPQAHGVADLVRRFAEGPTDLRRAWDAVPAAARTWRPGPGRWSAHEVAFHCADAAAVGYARLRYLLAEDDPVIVGWNQDAWAATFDYHAQPIDLAFSTIEWAIAGTVPLVRGLTPQSMARTGRHTEFGAITVESWVRYNAEHLHMHARQIERNVAAFGARE